MKRRDIFGAIFGTLCFSSAVRNSATAQAPLIQKVIDLRDVNSADSYFVMFIGRAQSLLPEALSGQPFSLGGHAYAGWGREDAAQQRSYASVYGLYPKEDAMGKWSLIIGSIPGEIREGLERDIGARLICRVSQRTYSEAQNVRTNYQSAASYQLLYNDCTTFIADVAKAVGLKTPDRNISGSAFPFPFVRSLVEINAQNDFLDGIWESSDTQRRWRLEISRNNCLWLERNQAGGSHRITTSVQERAGKRAILRGNDAAVLAFLGARQQLIGALLARSPQPSIMELTRQGADSVTARWSGFRWTLDAQNNLRDIQQPGASFTDFTFRRANS